MQKTVVINIVGLSERVLGKDTPFLSSWMSENTMNHIRPQLPAVTCSMQATYLTGKGPDVHGIVGNGWYFKDECEVKFWRQSNKLVQAPKIWDAAKTLDPQFTCANLFWWYNMYSTADYSVTPRPNYLADGRKIPDIYTHPPALRDQLQSQLGQFPLFEFWGPNTTIRSSQWIAHAAKYTDQQYNPTLTLVYLPHLDYGLQKYGHHSHRISSDLREIDALCNELISYYQSKQASIILLSEYGITPVQRHVALNRVLRREGWLQVREERGRELLDAGASKAFAVADHQIAHIYVKDKQDISDVKKLLHNTEGVAEVWGHEEKKLNKLDHPRAGDLVTLAHEDSWFTYYYWLQDAKAPDFARTVEIHRKPGYDPVEMFADPNIKWLKPLIGWKLLKKQLGFRTLMDVIPLDADLVSGSHGVLPSSKSDWPLISSPGLKKGRSLEAVEVYQRIWDTLTS